MYDILIGIVLIKIWILCGNICNAFVICYFCEHSEYEHNLKYFLPLFILSRFKSLLLQISSQKKNHPRDYKPTPHEYIEDKQKSLFFVYCGANFELLIPLQWFFVMLWYIVTRKLSWQEFSNSINKASKLQKCNSDALTLA